MNRCRQMSTTIINAVPAYDRKPDPGAHTTSCRGQHDECGDQFLLGGEALALRAWESRAVQVASALCDGLPARSDTVVPRSAPREPWALRRRPCRILAGRWAAVDV